MTSQALLNHAIQLALHLHEGQTRGDGRTPYVTHPLRVGFTLQGLGAPIEVVCAGLLHDTIEDTSASWDTLRTATSVEVADLVVAVTEDKRLPQAQRKAAIKASLASAPEGARMVKLADRLDNVREAGQAGWSLDKLIRYVEESKQILRIAGGAHAELAATLQQAIEALEAQIAQRQAQP